MDLPTFELSTYSLSPFAAHTQTTAYVIEEKGKNLTRIFSCSHVYSDVAADIICGL